MIMRSNSGTRPEKFLIVLGGTKSHHMLHPCPVIPAPIEQKPSPRQRAGVSNSAENTTEFFSFSVGIPNATTLQKTGIQIFHNPLNHNRLYQRASRPSNKITTLSFLELYPFQHFDKLQLKSFEFPSPKLFFLLFGKFRENGVTQ